MLEQLAEILRAAQFATINTQEKGGALNITIYWDTPDEDLKNLANCLFQFAYAKELI